MNAFEIAKQLKKDEQNRITNSILADLVKELNVKYTMITPTNARVEFVKNNSRYQLSIYLRNNLYYINVYKKSLIKTVLTTISYNELIWTTIATFKITDPFHKNLGEKLFQLGIY